MSYPPDPALLLNILQETKNYQDKHPTMKPMEELISCVLSQHTSDALSFPAFYKMMAHYKTWDTIELAPTEQLAEVIKGAGLSNQKSKRIQLILKQIREERGDYDIGFLKDIPLDEAKKWLISLPGIGPKCAAITLCFAFKLPAMPVDTHIFRVAWRLGYFEKKLGEAKAHNALEKIVPENLVFDFHVNLIQHGREICKAPFPRCHVCPLTSSCRYFQEEVVEKGAKTMA